MKKFFIAMLASLLVFGFTSCKCTDNVQESEQPALEQAELVVENTISTDRQAMFLNHGENYRWYETGVQLNNWLDEECDGSFNLVVNVFQTIEEYSPTCFDTFVIKYQHVGDEVLEESIHGFWVEDYPLNEEAVVVTFKEAFEKVMEVNLPKPHTRQVVLRKQVGPVEANPQWIFGNLHSQIYVDAVTGEVSAENPAFRGLNMGTPLGEWP